MPVEIANVLVLNTGGTIGMQVGPRGFGPAPGHLADQLERLPQFRSADAPRFTTPLSPLGKRIHFEIHEYDPLLDSSNVGMAEWAEIARDVQRHYDAYDGFVILHGTDTMAYTASALSFMLENLRKPVVLTGAQIPISQLRNDAHDNLLGALLIAGHYVIPEVTVYFADKLLRGNRTTKVDAKGLDAFASGNYPPLVEAGIAFSVDWSRVSAPTPGELRVQTAMSPDVAALRLFPGLTAATVHNFMRPPLRGVVFETFGSGNAPDRWPDLLAAIREATEAGLVVVNTTQCHRGRVSTSYASGRALADVGVIGGADMTPEAALTKLAFLLAQDIGVADVKQLMQRNLRGELTMVERRPRYSFRDRRFVAAVARALEDAHGHPAIETMDSVEPAVFPVLCCSAAAAGDVAQLQRLSELGADLNAADYDGRTPLHLAASLGHTDVARYLLREGVSITPRDRWGSTPIADAQRHGQHDMVALLEKHRE